VQKKKEISAIKKIQFSIVSILLFALAIVCVGEIILRIISEPEGPYYKKAKLDNDLGWRTKAFYNEDYKINTTLGEQYSVKFETTHKGFRHFGNVNSTKKKLLVIGDSYTQAVEANTDSIYAKHLADSLNLELFSYGQAGYGTYQQLLILTEFIDTINPDMVIVQMCDNDFIDNYAPLEYTSNYKVGVERPYLDINGNHFTQVAKPRYQRFLDKSLFLGGIRKRIETLFHKKEKLAQHQIGLKGLKYKPYKESKDITGVILDELKKTIDDVPILLFLVANFEPYRADLIDLCIQKNIPYSISPIDELKKLENNKVDIRTDDGYHWSEIGHRKIAEFLISDVNSNLNIRN